MTEQEVLQSIRNNVTLLDQFNDLLNGRNISITDAIAILVATAVIGAKDSGLNDDAEVLEAVILSVMVVCKLYSKIDDKQNYN